MGLGLASGIVQVSPPDAMWPAAFVAERARLLTAMGDLPVVIEHVGSTAIAGLVAKPILDLLAGRPADSDLQPYIAALESAGYLYRGEEGLPGREYFVRNGPDGRRTHHLHLVVKDGDFWISHLAFRDYLRRSPARMAAYAALKQDLATRYPNDRLAYTEGKADFIDETLRLAEIR
jgi:GrpB-like predicted nucleotidyltransferase (UPF0157 family)